MEDQRTEIKCERSQNRSNDAIVDLSGENAERNQLEIENEITEKQRAEMNSIEKCVRIHIPFEDQTEKQSQCRADDQRAERTQWKTLNNKNLILPSGLSDVVEDRRDAQHFENFFYLSVFLSDQTDDENQKSKRTNGETNFFSLFRKRRSCLTYGTRKTKSIRIRIVMNKNGPDSKRKSRRNGTQVIGRRVS